MNARTQEIVNSLLELNNLVNPVLTVTPATVTSAKNAVTNLSVQVKDFDGKPLPGYAVAVTATAGATAFAGAAPPPPRRRCQRAGHRRDGHRGVHLHRAREQQARRS